MQEIMMEPASNTSSRKSTVREFTIFYIFHRFVTQKSNHKYLYWYLVNLIDVKDKHGRCPLHCAALFANVEAVKTLIKANANPDQEWKSLY